MYHIARRYSAVTKDIATASKVNSIYTAVQGSSSLELCVFNLGRGVPFFTGGLPSFSGALSKCTVALGAAGTVALGAAGTVALGAAGTVGRGVSFPDELPLSESSESPLGAPTFVIGFSDTISNGGSSSS